MLPTLQMHTNYSKDEFSSKENYFSDLPKLGVEESSFLKTVVHAMTDSSKMSTLTDLSKSCNAIVQKALREGINEHQMLGILGMSKDVFDLCLDPNEYSTKLKYINEGLSAHLQLINTQKKQEFGRIRVIKDNLIDLISKRITIRTPDGKAVKLNQNQGSLLRWLVEEVFRFELDQKIDVKLVDAMDWLDINSGNKAMVTRLMEDLKRIGCIETKDKSKKKIVSFTKEMKEILLSAN